MPAPNESSTLLKGHVPEILAGRYRVISVIGRGGMGSVWRGEHMSLGNHVAIKLLEPRLASSEALRARFLREARAAASLRSANVVQIFDHGVEGDTPFIVMELLDGESLGAKLWRDKKLEPEELARVFTGVGRAIARAHKAGIVHRDLKPDNIFLARDEDGAEVVKVVDFGIAKILESDAPVDVSTDTGAMLGTPHYMSPEQARGVKGLDTRADLWAMSVIAFECLVGRRPFVATALGDLVIKICLDPVPIPSECGEVPPGFDAWFARAMRRPIDERFQTVHELIRALEDVITPGRHLLGDSAGDPARPSTPANLETDPTMTAGEANTPRKGDETPVVAVDLRTPTEGASTKSIAAAKPSTSRRPLFVGLAAVALAIPGAFWIAKRQPATSTPPSDPTTSASERPTVERAVPSAAPQGATGSRAVPTTLASAAIDPREVTIRITSNPSGAEVRRGKDKLGVAGDAIALPFGHGSVVLTIEKKGFQPSTVEVVPDADRKVEVTLQTAKASGLPTPPGIAF